MTLIFKSKSNQREKRICDLFLRQGPKKNLLKCLKKQRLIMSTEFPYVFYVAGRVIEFLLLGKLITSKQTFCLILITTKNLSHWEHVDHVEDVFQKERAQIFPQIMML